MAISEETRYGGRFAYVGNIDLLKVFDVSDMENPIEIGQVALPGSFIGSIRVQGDHAYVWTREAGLRIFDVQDPWQPREIGHFDDGCLGVSGSSSELLGSYALVNGGGCADGGSPGIQVIDLSDPSRPVHVASIDGRYRRFAVSESRLLAETSHYPEDGWTLDVIDLSDVLHPRHLGSYRTTADEYAWEVAAGGSLAFVRTSSGLAAIDYSDPAQPTRLSTPYGEYFFPMAAADGHLYGYSLVEWPPKLRIVSFSDPANPVEIGTCPLPYHGSPYFWPDVALIEGYVVLAHGIQGLLVVDVNSPAHPRVVAQLFDGVVSDLAVSGTFAYWLSSKWTFSREFDSTVLQIADVTDPRDPIDVGLYTTDRQLYRDIAVSNSRAYLVGDSGLAVLDVSDPSAPSEVGAIDVPASAIVVSGSHAFLASAAPAQGIRVIDIADPENLREIAILPSVNVAQEAIAVSGSRAFIAAAGRDGFRVIDISDASSPREVATLDLPDWRSDWWGSMTIVRSRAYLAAGSAGIIVIDVSDPLDPRTVSRLEPSSWDAWMSGESAGSIAVSRRKAYFGAVWALHVVDLSDPSGLPEVLVPYPLPFRFIPFWTEIAIRGPTAFVADGTAGSSILDLSGCDEIRLRDPARRNTYTGVN